MTDDRTGVMKSEDTLRMSEKVEKKSPGRNTEFGNFDALNLTVVQRL